MGNPTQAPIPSHYHGNPSQVPIPSHYHGNPSQAPIPSHYHGNPTQVPISAHYRGNTGAPTGAVTYENVQQAYSGQGNQVYYPDQRVLPSRGVTIYQGPRR